MTGEPATRLPIFVLTGIPGSGKSTVANLLARRFEPAALVGGDVLRRMVVTGRVEMGPKPEPEAEKQYGLRLRHLAWLCDSYAAAGFTVVAEDNLLGHHLAAFLDRVEARPLHVVALIPELDTVLRRDSGRAVQAHRKAGDARALDEVLRTGTAKVGLWVDTTGQGPEETVEEILRRLPESAIA